MKNIIKRLKEYYEDNIYLACVMFVFVVVIIGILIAFILEPTKKHYFYGKDNVNGHSNSCYASEKGGLWCEIPMQVDWFYEEDEHE